MKKELKKRNQGITLIALVITVIVLLILAGVTIATLTGDNGVFIKAQTAKENTDIGKEKEIISLAATEARMNNSRQTLEEKEFQTALDNYANGKTEVESSGDKFIIYFIETNRFYTIDKDGNINEENKITDSNPGDITISQEGNQLTGDKEQPYEIYSIEDFLRFSQMSNDGEEFEGKYIKLINSLDFKASYSYVNEEDTNTFGDYNEDGIKQGIKDEVNLESERGFIIIKDFYGTFLGNNKKISNIYINAELGISKNILGIIENNYGAVENLYITGNIKVNAKDATLRPYCIGGVTGYNYGNINNVKSGINIDGESKNKSSWLYIGGIAGRNEKEINNCINTGDMNIGGLGDNRIAGISGYTTTSSIIRNSINAGNFKVESTDYACIGGITLESQGGIIENCLNKGRLEAIGKTRVYLSGISSMPTKTTIDGCYNEGELIASGYALRIAGISAAPEDNIISNCYNKGTIKTRDNSSIIRVGGIVGDVSVAITLKNCYNIGTFDIKGAVTAKGSIYGIMKGSMDNCYYTEQDGFEIGQISNSSEITNSGSKTSEQMKSDEFITLLNKNSQKFKKDDNNINRGYPVLDWQ